MLLSYKFSSKYNNIRRLTLTFSIVMLYLCFISLMNVIIKTDLYTYLLMKNLDINLKQIDSIKLTSNRISGHKNKFIKSKYILINDFMEAIKEIKILLSCFNIRYLNLKYIPIYKPGLYYGISNTENGILVKPSNIGLSTISFKDSDAKENARTLNLGFPEIAYSSYVKYSLSKKVIQICNLQDKDIQNISLVDIKDYNSVDVIQKVLFVILNCQVKLID